MGSGFTHVPGGDDYRNRSVFSYNYYCTILQLTPVPGNGTIPGFDRVLCDDIEGPALFESTLKDVKQLGGASFLTEFGGCGDSPTCAEQLNWGMTNADLYFQSWAYWGYVYGDMATVKQISRSYARAIAGQPNMMRYDVDTRSFVLTYTLDTSIKKPTEIYLPSLVYPNARYNVTVNEYIQWKVDPMNSNIILIEQVQQRIYSQARNVLAMIQITPTVQSFDFV